MQRLTHPQQEGAADECCEWIGKHNAQTLLLAVSLWGIARREGMACCFFFHFSMLFTLLCIYFPPVSPHHVFLPALTLFGSTTLTTRFTFLTSCGSLFLFFSYIFSHRALSLSLCCSAGPNYRPVESVYNSTHRSLSLLLVCASETHKGGERGDGNSGGKKCLHSISCV